MLRCVSVKTTVGFLSLFLGMICSAFAQQAPREEGKAGGGEGRPRATAAPLFLKVDWVRPANQIDTKVRYMPVQENVGDPNVEMKFYGSAKQVLTTGAPGSDVTPYGIWTGTAESGPFAITFKLKNNDYVDLTGLAYIRWSTKTSGFHVVRPVLKLANGTLVVGDLAFSSVPKRTVSEFSLTNVRWIKLDPEKVVTVNSGPAAANPNNEVWVPNPDLSKVEEIGFADLLPGSGHGTGGYIELGPIEVYGKTVPRTAATGGR
jgi:hypothetical protein